MAEKREPRLRLAVVYILFQKWMGILPPIEALRAGTVFKELIRPYRPD